MYLTKSFGSWALPKPSGGANIGFQNPQLDLRGYFAAGRVGNGVRQGEGMEKERKEKREVGITKLSPSLPPGGGRRDRRPWSHASMVMPECLRTTMQDRGNMQNSTVVLPQTTESIVNKICIGDYVGTSPYAYFITIQLPLFAPNIGENAHLASFLGFLTPYSQ